MPRTARLTIVNMPHHVHSRACRGNIFYANKDYEKYLQILHKKARQYKADILAYCLMPDHINLVIVPHRRNSLARVVGRTQFAYTKYIKTRRKHIKELWAGRFQSCVLGKSYLKTAIKYVESQPVYAHVVRKAQKYPFSSAAAHIAANDETEVLVMDTLPASFKGKQWLISLTKKLNEETRNKIATYTQTGRPLGSEEFVTSLEKKLHRRLHPLPVGRPKKSQ